MSYTAEFWIKKLKMIAHPEGGCSTTIFVINPDGKLRKHYLGPDFNKRQKLQLVVPANQWFAAKPANPKGYGLMGCTLSPGFDFADFELGNRTLLARQYPQYKKLILSLTSS